MEEMQVPVDANVVVDALAAKIGELTKENAILQGQVAALAAQQSDKVPDARVGGQ